MLELALAERRVILTHDADFGTAAVSGRAAIIGIVFLRPGHHDPARTIESLEALGKEPIVVVPPFIMVVERSVGRISIRIRRLPEG